MMGHRESLKTGDEWDVFTRWRKLLKCCGKAGHCRDVKRRFNKRLRREARKEVREEFSS